MSTRHIPVQVIVADEGRERALRHGARGVMQKPMRKTALAETFSTMRQSLAAPIGKILLVEQDEEQRQSLGELLGGPGVTLKVVTSGDEAIAALAEERPDVMVCGYDLPGFPGLALVDRIAQESALAELPVLVYSTGEVSASDEATLARLGQSLILKLVRSRGRLLDEVSVFVHRDVALLSEAKRKLLAELHEADTTLAGKKVLVVDDDVRNIFAMTTILDVHRMSTISAETGAEAIEVLDQTPDIDIVLMDIMMPDMDGYDTMRAIRQRTAFRGLPIIAVTAKAMKGDRDKCFEAGATDYIAKPVDPGQLVDMLRGWLHE